MNSVKNDSMALKDRLFLFIATVTLARMAVFSFHGLIIASFDDFLIPAIVAFPILLIGCIFYVLMILAFRSFFKLVYEKFSPYIDKKNFDLAVTFGIIFFVLPLPSLAFISAFSHFAELQVVVKILLMFRLVLICGAVIAHCIFFAASLKELISEQLKKWFKLSAGLIALCLVFALSLTVMSFEFFNYAGADNYLGAIVNLIVVEFWLLVCITPYAIVLMITFWNLSKRLAPQAQSHEEQR